MSVQESAAVLADGLADLAVADPATDLCLENVVSRLDAGLERIASRLDGHLDAAATAQLRNATDLITVLPEAERRALLIHPYHMWWRVSLYERCVDGDRATAQTAMLDIGRFPVVPALRTGLFPDDGLTMRASAGELRFPGAARHVLLPSGTPDGPVRMRRAGDDVTVTGPGCDIRVPVAELTGDAPIGNGSPVASRPVLPGSAIEVDAGDPFVHDLFASMNSRPPLPNYPPRDLAPMPTPSAQQLAGLAAAARLVERAWPEAGRELLYYTRLIVPFVSRCYSTFAEAAFFGAVFMGECRHPFTDLMYTAEQLLHEHSHLRMHLLMEQDPIFHADPDKLIASPWRRDPRPVVGVVQAVFVFSRVARFLRYAHHLLDEDQYAARRAEVTRDVRAGLRVLRETDDVSFTPLGEHLLGQCADEADTATSTRSRP